MQTHIYYLTSAENTLLNLMAEEYSTRHILQNCEIPLSGFHIFCAEIKRKLGISGRLIHECKPFLAKYSAAMANQTRTTPEQTRVIRQYVQGETLQGMAYTLKMSEDATQALIDDACKAAAIFTRDERARRAQLRLYLALFRFNGLPLSPMEETILRGMAAGKSFEEIADGFAVHPVKFVKQKAKAACHRLYFDISGRNTQRTLLRAYFAYIDQQKPSEITMEDPMF